MANPAIIMPWRLTPDREASMLTAFRHNSQTFSDIPIYKSDSTKEKFNRSEARNLGCDQAIADGHDILIVLDADTIFDRSGVDQAIKMITEHGAKFIMHPYNRDFEIWFSARETIEQEQEDLDNIRKNNNSNNGHIGSGWVMTSEVFKHINGWDERFTEWGWEDNALDFVNKTLFNESIPHMNGCAIRLMHGMEDRNSGMMSKISEEHYINNYAYITNITELKQLISGNR